MMKSLLTSSYTIKVTTVLIGLSLFLGVTSCAVKVGTTPKEASEPFASVRNPAGAGGSAGNGGGALSAPPSAVSVSINAAASFASSQTVSVAFVVSDDVAVTNVCIQESSIAPGAADTCWDTDVVSPNAYTFSSDGSKTLYVFAKDVDGSVSTSANDSIGVDTDPPTAPTVIFRADDTTYASGHESADNDTALSVVWSGASDATSGLATSNTYRVYVYDESGTACAAGGTNSASAVASATQTAVHYAYTGAGTKTYKAQVRVYDAMGFSSWSACSASMTITLPPTSLTYSSNPATYTKWTAITNNTPTSGGGAVASYSITPALPTGLSLNTTTGVISGTPSQHDEAGTNYTVTATNAGGSATATLNIKVMIPSFTWLNTTQDDNWSTAANWKGAAVPISTSNVIFDDSCGSYCNATTSANIAVRSLILKSTYTGTLTQGTGRTITVGTGVFSTRGGFEVEGGTFLGSDANIRADYLSIQNTAIFTSTSLELRLGMHVAHNSTTLGFQFGSTAVFNHNNGTVYIDGEGDASAYRRPFQMTLNQKLILYNFKTDIKSNALIFGAYDSHYMDIAGTSGTVEVINELDFIDGRFLLGTIEFLGNNVNFYCDAPTAANICSGTITEYNGTTMSVAAKLVFKGTAPQTYTFNDGAAAIGFHIENPSGVSTASTGTLGVAFLKIISGAFTAPAGTLSIGKDVNTRYMSHNSDGFRVEAGGSFIHNNGRVSFESYNYGYNDGRVAASIYDVAGVGIDLYDMRVNLRGVIENAGPGPFNYRLGIHNNTVVNIENSLVIDNGYIVKGWGGSGYFAIYGTYARNCSNQAAGICSLPNENVRLRFLTGASQITVDSNAPTPSLCSGGDCGFLVNIGAGNTLTMNSNFSVPVSVTLTSGTLNFAAGISGSVSGSFINNSIVTCGAGAYMSLTGSVSGTPLGGNTPACYGH